MENNNSDNKLALMCGLDVLCSSLNLTIHPLKIKEIAMLGERNFFAAVQCLCVEKEFAIQDKQLLSQINNFQIFMGLLNAEENKNIKNNVKNLLKMLFPQGQIIFTPKSLNIMIEENVVMIDENNFMELQKIIKEVLCLNNLFQGKNILYNPKGERAKKIVDKIMKCRQKIAAQKAQKQQESILDKYLSILQIGALIPLKESIEYNLFQLFSQMERYNAFLEWDVDMKVRLAGGKPKKQVENWMRNL